MSKSADTIAITIEKWTVMAVVSLRVSGKKIIFLAYICHYLYSLEALLWSEKKLDSLRLVG